MKKIFPAHRNDRRGFTLIEIIVAMTIMGLLVLLGSFGLRNAVDGYTLARDNAQLSQKAQAALDRMTVEFAGIPFSTALGRYNISSGTSSSITYTANFGGADENHTIARVGSQVHLDNIPLTDLVATGNGLLFTYMNSSGAVVGGGATDGALRIIGISLTLNGPNGSSRVFNTRVALQK